MTTQSDTRRRDEDDTVDGHDSGEEEETESVAAASPFSWCLAYLEHDVEQEDEDQDEDGGDTDHDDIDASSAGSDLTRLLREYGRAPSAGTSVDEDERVLLGLQCDCPCDSCRMTCACHSWQEYMERCELVEGEQQRHAENDEGETMPQSCQCLEADEAEESQHSVITELLEDFFRLRVHMHRVTFTHSMSALRRQRALRDANGILTDAVSSSHKHDGDRSSSSSSAFDEHASTTFHRSLSLLEARARRDLHHLELFESCANNLGWNHPDAPSFSQAISFCDLAQPGPTVLAGIVNDFLTFFLHHKTEVSSSVEMEQISRLMRQLIEFAIRCGDIDPLHPLVQSCVNVCECALLNLPLAAMVESELSTFVEKQRDARERRRRTERRKAMRGKRKRHGQNENGHDADDDSEDAESDVDSADEGLDGLLPSAASLPSEARVAQAIQGYWSVSSCTLIHAQASTSATSIASTDALPSSSSPLPPPDPSSPSPSPFVACLTLTPLMHTPSKQEMMDEIVQAEKKRSNEHQSNKQGEGRRNHGDSGAGSSQPKPKSCCSADKDATYTHANQPSFPSSPDPLSSNTAVCVLVPPTIHTLLSSSSDGGDGWQLSLELTRFYQPSSHSHVIDEPQLEPYFHITRVGHVRCI